jgi:hypothetical protein
MGASRARLVLAAEAGEAGSVEGDLFLVEICFD